MADMRNHTVVGIGEILWDMLPDGRQLGGAPANFAYHACQLGNRGVVLSSIGHDSDGEDILRLLEEKKIGHILDVSASYPTGTVSVTMKGDGSPEYTIHENVAWDFMTTNNNHLRLMRQAEVVCYGSLAQRNSVSAGAITRMIESTSPNCVRICDINLRQSYYSKEILEHLLILSTILKLNDDELGVVTSLFELSGNESELLQGMCTKFQLDLVILTKGADGSRLFSPRMGDSFLQSEKVELADSVGAGDSFTAAVATGLCRGMKLEEVHRLASRVASYVCGQRGATPQLPPLKDLLQL